MQDLSMLSGLMWEISLGIFLFGLFYVFGMFTLGKLFAAFGEGETDHDVEHDIDHDVDHEVDHDVETDHDIDHEVDHDVETDHDIDHDVDHEISGDHDVEHAVDDVPHEIEHGTEHDVDHEFHPDHQSGFFETERGAPLGVTIGTTLLSFGFLGIVFYSSTVLLAFPLKVGIHFFGVFLTVFSVRTMLGKLLVESGFYMEPKHLVGREVEAVSTISDAFGEIRTETEMGLRRFNARPFQRGAIYEKGTKLYIVSAGDKFVFVDPKKDVMKWVEKQSKRRREDEHSDNPETS